MLANILSRYWWMTDSHLRCRGEWPMYNADAGKPFLGTAIGRIGAETAGSGFAFRPALAASVLSS
jgi:hypothetical protein